MWGFRRMAAKAAVLAGSPHLPTPLSSADVTGAFPYSGRTRSDVLQGRWNVGRIWEPRESREHALMEVKCPWLITRYGKNGWRQRKH
jgi:hypothetical protein